jgi:hypothetical protein
VADTSALHVGSTAAATLVTTEKQPVGNGCDVEVTAQEYETFTPGKEGDKPPQTTTEKQRCLENATRAHTSGYSTITADKAVIK